MDLPPFLPTFFMIWSLKGGELLLDCPLPPAPLPLSFTFPPLLSSLAPPFLNVAVINFGRPDVRMRSLSSSLPIGLKS